MKFGVVLVTFNRLDKLKIALECYEKQTYKPEILFVIDNASSDGTKEFLDKWSKKKGNFKKEIIHLKTNTGGSGGFHEGLKKALAFDLDYVWVSDDDAFPEADCFEIANNFLLNNSDKNISAICGTVMNRGKIDIVHRRRLKRLCFFPIQTFISKREYAKAYFKLNLFTYVGTFINVSKMKEVGVTIKDYFIYCDDTEHSYRLSLVGDIFCVPKIKIVHDGPLNNGKDGVNWKLYYGVRNSIDFLKRDFPKRYYYTYKIYFRLKYYAMITLLWPNKVAGYKLINKAIKDGKNGKLGLDSLYRPGWKANEKK
ncbi:MAG: glycosyltransferase [Bacilli bacterium]|nr:glycosyltransferase [Bacilli bacterium]